MTTENLPPSEMRPRSMELPVPALQAGGDDLNFSPRKLNRVGSPSSHNNGGPPKTVGQRLVVRRLEMGLTQEEVASRVAFRPKSGKRGQLDCQLSRNAYCMYELDKAEPSLRTFFGLAHALGVSPEWLAFGVDRNLAHSCSTLHEPVAPPEKESGDCECTERALRDSH